VVYAKVSLETHPGVISRNAAASTSNKNLGRIKNIKKVHLLHYTVHDVMRNWHKISNGKFNNTVGVYAIGSREKIQKLDYGDLAKTRPLFIPEFCDLLVGSTWLELLKDNWKSSGLFKGEIWLGHADQDMRFYRRIELDLKFDYSYEFDGKNWDATVMTEVIKRSFEVYASCFKQTKAVVNHFRFMYETFVYKKVILHNGNSFLLYNGVPSGHAWTANINSMANWIIWTSCVHNCPHIPDALRRDYELQIQGDDIVLHTNVLLTSDIRQKICEWMLHNFNYKAKDGTINPLKNASDDINNNSSFLKRSLDSMGNLVTKETDIWEKILLGPEYSGLRGSRSTYFLRRINDLAIYNKTHSKRLAIYFAFIEQMENKLARLSYSKKEGVYVMIYQNLFRLTNAFTQSCRQKWNTFKKLSGVSGDDIVRRSEEMHKHIQGIYSRNYHRYDTKTPYIDYWKQGKESVTVTHALKNYLNYPIFPYGRRRKKK
jgi:hypothetical protein